MAGPFDSGLSNLTLQLDVLFPSNVTSGPGITVNKTNAVWSVNVDIVDLTENTSISTPSGYFVMVWDTALARLEKVRLDNLNLPTLVDFRSPIGDANYAVLVTDRYVGLTATLTAIRTITLPAASTVPAGRQVVIQDEVGGISPAFYHSIVPTGADTINGGGSWIQKTARGGAIFRSNGSNAWNVLVFAGRSAVADANYTATAGDLLIAYTSITAARTVTLPAAAAYQKGQQLTVIDESGSCSATNTIGITRAGADTINGLTSLALNQAYAYVALESDGVSKWTIADSSVPLTAAAISGSRIALRIDQRTGVGDAIYTILNTDAYVATTAALTAPRIWTLPAANTLNPGQEVVIYDEFGGVTATNTLTIARGSTDTINGATSFVLDRAYQGISLRSNGVGIWSFEDPAGPIDGTPIGQVTPAAGSFTTLSATTSATLSPSGAVTIQPTGAATIKPTAAGTMDNMAIGGTTAANGTFTNLTASVLLTSNNLILNSGAMQVGGRLTLTSVTPVLTGAVAAAGTVYFTPYLGNLAPFWNGTQFVWIPIAELSNILANSATGNAGPAAAAASQVYDLYLWLAGGTTPTLTRSPAWSAGTGGSNTVRGTGAGGSAQTRVNGIWTNTVAITNGPAAGFGTYVGTIATDSGGGTVSWSRGSAGSGGVAAALNVWNMFNRVLVSAVVVDNGASYTYTSSTIRQARASTGNQINMVVGQQEDGIQTTYMARGFTVAAANAAIYWGIAFDATAIFTIQNALMVTPSAAIVGFGAPCSGTLYPSIGVHFLAAVEKSDNVNANTYDADSANVLSALLRM